MQVNLTPEQNAVLRERIQEGYLKALIAYPSGRLEAEFIEADDLFTRVDLTPDIPRRKTRGRRWTLLLLFGGMLWSGAWALARAVDYVTLPTAPWLLLVGLGLAAMVGGIVLAEKQLGTPLLVSPAQSKVLRRFWDQEAHVYSLSGGGGTSLMGRGDLLVHLHLDGKDVRYVIGASGRVRPLE